jgi:16S rRNA (cytosine967-C5)-methyltransferase
VIQKDKPRDRALDILWRVEAGAFADVLLDKARQSFEARDSAFILELVYGVLRNRSRLDWALNQLSVQPIHKTDAWTRNILRLGAYQLLFLDRVPSSAAVNTATELAKSRGKKQGYVNGLLRNLDRNRDTITYPGPEDLVRQSAILYSHPEWLVQRWVRRFGAELALSLLRENNHAAPLVVRANALKATRSELKAALASHGAESRETHYSTVGLEIISSPGLRSIPAYDQGWFMVQDEAAQLISYLLSPQPRDMVLDACAAPGGKATHLAELMQNNGTVIALESDAARIDRIRENSQRLGTTIVVPVLGDAATFQGSRFDKILIDAPCSGLGVLRRHPDGRWNKSERLIRERAAVQRRILENCTKLLKTGGSLVYATCTTEPEENEEIITSLLSSAGGALTLSDPRPYLPGAAASLVDENGFFHSYPQAPGMDGFFGARLIKRTEIQRSSSRE